MEFFLIVYGLWIVGAPIALAALLILCGVFYAGIYIWAKYDDFKEKREKAKREKERQKKIEEMHKLYSK